MCAVVVVLAGCGPHNEAKAPPAQSQKQPVEVTTLVKRDLYETVSVVGSFAPNESAEIRPEIAGQIREISFEEGQPVKKGHLLVKIDDAELRAQYAQTESRYKLAELNLARNQGLVESKTVSQADFDRVRAEFSAATAELSLLKVRLDKTEIRAPFDGMTGARTLSPGDYVNTQSVITVLNDLTRLKIDFQVAERFLHKVKVGTKFTVQSKTLSTEKPVEGEVYFVSSLIDRNTRSSEVKGLLAQPPEKLKPGMFANIELVLDVRSKVLTAPEGAILSTPSGSQLVAVKDSGTDKVAEFIPVKLGLRARGVVEVEALKGELTEKHTIVAAGVGSLVLFPGGKLEPRPLREEFRMGGDL